VYFVETSEKVGLNGIASEYYLGDGGRPGGISAGILTLQTEIFMTFFNISRQNIGIVP
jgi:hypothetical protein